MNSLGLNKMKDSFKTFPKIKVYSSDVAQWMKRIEKELRDLEIKYVEERAKNYPNPELYGKIVLIREILGDD